GLHWRIISNTLGYPASTLHNAVVTAMENPDYVPAPPTTTWTAERIAILREMAPSGCGSQAISDALGLRDSTVRSYASAHGIKIKRSPTPNVGGSNASPPVPAAPRDPARA